MFRPLIQFGLLSLALWVTATRVSDYKHHPTDVFAGGILGLSVAYVTVYFVLELSVRPRIFHNDLQDHQALDISTEMKEMT